MYKFPHSINRNTFDLDYYNTWKAIEFKNFFFYMALPILKDILLSQVYWNLVCLVYGS